MPGAWGRSRPHVTGRLLLLLRLALAHGLLAAGDLGDLGPLGVEPLGDGGGDLGEAAFEAGGVGLHLVAEAGDDAAPGPGLALAGVEAEAGTAWPAARATSTR